MLYLPEMVPLKCIFYSFSEYNFFFPLSVRVVHLALFGHSWDSYLTNSVTYISMFSGIYIYIFALDCSPPNTFLTRAVFPFCFCLVTSYHPFFLFFTPPPESSQSSSWHIASFSSPSSFFLPDTLRIFQWNTRDFRVKSVILSLLSRSSLLI